MTTNELRNARREFRNRYGRERFEAIQLLVGGLTTAEVAQRLGVTTGSIAAVKANLTRGTYGPYVTVTSEGSVQGTCFRS